MVKRSIVHTEKYQGVNITIYRRYGLDTDYMYETDAGIGGAGQKTLEQALADARKAIDERAEK